MSLRGLLRRSLGVGVAFCFEPDAPPRDPDATATAAAVVPRPIPAVCLQQQWIHKYEEKEEEQPAQDIEIG